jgi:hypothetical protein
MTSALAIITDFRVGVLFAGDRITASRCEWVLRRWTSAREMSSTHMAPPGGR